MRRHSCLITHVRKRRIVTDRTPLCQTGETAFQVRVALDIRTFSTNTKPRQSESYCVDLVKLRDREAYYCGLLMPPASRDAFFALRAFNAEVASIKDRSSSSETTALALQLRMQWWRDAVTSIYESKPLENPVVLALAKANEKHTLTRRFLDRIIDAREADLEVNQYQTVAALAHYAESTVCSLFYLTLECMEAETHAADEMAYHAGIGVGVTTALRGTPYLLSNKEMPVPIQLLGETFRITEADNIEENETFRMACQQLSHFATEHFVRARQIQGSLHASQRSVFLSMLPSINYLAKLERARYNVFEPTVVSAGSGSDRLSLLLSLGRSWITGVY